MPTSYSIDAHVLLCCRCGAVAAAAAGDREVRCGACGSTEPLDDRDDAVPLRGSDSDVPDDVYFHRLRAQDQQPLRTPPALAPLLQGGQLSEDRQEEALEIFRATCEEVRRTRGHDAAERLHWLTMVLATHLFVRRDHLRRRALLETALSVFFLRRHVQVARCLLGQSAAGERDFESAEAWLSPCNPRLGDLESDSALRIARAFLHTVRGDFDAVLRLLGTQGESVPVFDPRDAEAAMLRANALEKKGLVASAVSVLEDRARREGAGAIRTMQTYAALRPELTLCTESLPIALRRQRDARARRITTGSGLGWALLATATVPLFVAITAWAELIATGHAPRLDPGSESNVGGLLCAAPIGALVLIVLGWRLVAVSVRQARIARRGIWAWGIVTAIEGTGININDVPRVRVHVRVQRPGVAPVSATCVAMLTPELQARATVGAEVPLLVDPSAPEHVLLLID